MLQVERHRRSRLPLWLLLWLELRLQLLRRLRWLRQLPLWLLLWLQLRLQLLRQLRWLRQLPLWLLLWLQLRLRRLRRLRWLRLRCSAPQVGIVALLPCRWPHAASRSAAGGPHVATTARLGWDGIQRTVQSQL